MKRSLKSHLVNDAIVQHPFTSVASSLVDSSGRVARIGQNVRRLAGNAGIRSTPTCFNIQELKKQMNQKDLEFLRAKIRNMISLEPVNVKSKIIQGFPNPPSAVELYGRLGKGLEVLDVGCGDGRRIIPYAGQLNLYTMDLVVSKPKVRSKHYVGKFAGCDGVITSFNVLTQNFDIKPFLECDGLHIYPLLKYWLRDNLSVKKTSGEVHTKLADGALVEFEHDLPCVQYGGYYAGTNSFTERAYEFTEIDVADPCLFPSYGSFGNRVTMLPDSLPEATIKLNGQLYKLRKKDNLGYLISRDGAARTLTTQFDEIEFEIKVENYEGKFYLLEVTWYSGFVPFHSLSLLHHFLKRVRIKINGIELLAPIKYEPEKYMEMVKTFDAEGVVFRQCNRDYLLRHFHSFDIKFNNVEVLADTLSHGKKVLNCIEHYEGIHEILCVEDKDQVRLVNLGKREKKKEDKVSGFANVLCWPTMNEFLGYQSVTQIHLCGSKMVVNESNEINDGSEMSPTDPLLH